MNNNRNWDSVTTSNSASSNSWQYGQSGNVIITPTPSYHWYTHPTTISSPIYPYLEKVSNGFLVHTAANVKHIAIELKDAVAILRDHFKEVK